MCVDLDVVGRILYYRHNLPRYSLLTFPNVRYNLSRHSLLTFSNVNLF